MHLQMYEQQCIYKFVILKLYCPSVQILVLFGLLILSMKAKYYFEICGYSRHRVRAQQPRKSESPYLLRCYM